MDEVFLPKIGAPATRALAAAGITSYDELARWKRADLAALHGVGPKALAMLDAALAAHLAGTSSPQPAEPVGPTSPVDAYLDGLDAAPRHCLLALRQTLGAVLPHGEEAIRYGMPAVLLDGVAVAGYGAFRDHCSYFPMSGTVLDAAGTTIEGFQRSKGGFRFGFDERLPVALLRRLVKLRLAELAAVTNGIRREYYDDGRCKAVGPMKQGELHGSWSWFRRDGTLLRTGQFARGAAVGTWTTWNRDATPAKVTHRPR